MDKLKQAKEVFDKFDLNGNGHISALELKLALVALGAQPTDTMIQHMVRFLIEFIDVFFKS